MIHVPTVAVIPTALESALLGELLLELVDQNIDQVFLFDNSTTQDAEDVLDVFDYAPRNIEVIPALGERLYAMWNRGWELALRYSKGYPVNVAFLNDDIAIGSHFIDTLGTWLRSDEKWWCVYPDYNALIFGVTSETITATTGTFKDGGMCGWAFMIRGELLRAPLPAIDEHFVWWCGDDDLARQITMHGGLIGRVNGLGLRHVGSASARNHPELDAIGWEDMARLQRKYG